jgi:hypothetical protein
VTNKLWSHRGEHEDKPSNHCAGKAGLLPLNLYAHVRFCLLPRHMRPRVQRAPGLPCALFLLGERILQNSGAVCRENAEVWIEKWNSRHPEVCVVFDAPRRMVFSIVRAAILRDAAKTPLLRMTSEINFTDSQSVESKCCGVLDTRRSLSSGLPKARPGGGYDDGSGRAGARRGACKREVQGDASTSRFRACPKKLNSKARPGNVQKGCPQATIVAQPQHQMKI